MPTLNRFFKSVYLCRMKSFFIATLLLSLGAHAQPFTFSKTFDGSADDEYTSSFPTSDGNYLATGYTWGSPYGGLATKLNPAGVVIWSKTVGGTRILRSAETSSGLFFLGGENVVSSNSNFYLAKISGNGTVLWAKTFGKSAEPDQFRDMRLTSDGGCIMVGCADTAAGAGFTPIAYIIKVDSSGNLQWSKYIGGGQGEEFYVAKELSGGGYLACGYTHSYGSQVGNENYLVRFDAGGNVLWKQVFGHAQRFDYIADFVEAPGGFLVTGNCAYGSNTDNAFLAKVDAAGNELWFKTYNMGAGSSTLLRLSDNNLLIAGYNTDQTLGIYNDSYLVKTDTSGNLIWARKYGVSGEDDRLLSARETSDGGFLLSGSVYSSFQLRAAWIAKTDAAGVSGCRDSSFTPTVGTLPLAATNGGNEVSVFFGNNSASAQLVVNLSGAAYCANTTTGIDPLTDASGILLYPNPASGILMLERTDDALLAIRVYDVYGRCVLNVPASREKTIQFSLEDFPAGVYLIRGDGAGGSFLREVTHVE